MVEQTFKPNERILIMTEAYPFFLVGTIQYSKHDIVAVKAEFGVPLPLKDHVFHFKKDAIQAFYVEEDYCKIPTVW